MARLFPLQSLGFARCQEIADHASMTAITFLRSAALGLLILVSMASLQGGELRVESFEGIDGNRSFSRAEVVGNRRAGSFRGMLRLALDGDRGETAALKVDDLDPGRRIEAFTVGFDLAMFSRENQMGAGLMFTFGAIPEDTAGDGRRGFARERGLSVHVHTSRDEDNPPAIKTIVSGRTVASAPVRFAHDDPAPKRVEIHWDDDGLDVSYGGELILEDRGVGDFRAELGFRFAFSAATRSSRSQTTLIDNLAVTTRPYQPLKTGSVILSEVLPIPHAGLKDEEGEVSEWIEVYNGSGDEVDLEGWSLRMGGQEWMFPTFVLPAHEFGIIFATGKDRADPGRVLHARFSLPDAGGMIALCDAGGSEQSRFEYGAASPDVSYGWVDKPEMVGFLEDPTPGAQNRGEPLPNAEAPVVSMSHVGGIVRAPVTVSITSGALPEGGVIRYSLGASSPKEESPIYESPIVVERSTTVRAAVFAPGYLRGPVAQSAFVFLDRDVQQFTSNLPVIVADSAGAHIDSDYRPWVKRKYRPVHANIFDTKGERARLTQEPDYSGFGALRVRGHSSATLFPKKQYAWEVRDDCGEDQDVSLLGMPAESDWVLAAPFSDKTLMRNVLAFEMGRQLFGQGGGSRTRFVELFLNQNGDDVTMGDYQGVYVLTEKIKQGPSRINVEELSPFATSVDEISGGYIFNIDKGTEWDETIRTNTHSMEVAFVEPDKPTGAQKAYLRDYLDRYERALQSDDFDDPELGYAAFIDTESFIHLNWMVEIFREIDGWWISSFFSKPRGGKIRAMPLWDYNLSLGNADYKQGYRPTGWHRDTLPGNGHPWFHRLFDDPLFEQRYWERYFELRQSLFSTHHLLGLIDDYAETLRESAARNFSRWPILGRHVWPNAPGARARRTFDAEVDWMKDWLRTRLEWIDQQYIAPPKITRSGGIVTMELPPGVDGEIFYTTDGTDPGRRGRNPWRSLVTSSKVPAEVLIPSPKNAGHRLEFGQWTGTAKPPNSGQWTKVKNGAVGFEELPADYEPYIHHHVREMFGNATGCYIRIPFSMDDHQATAQLERIALRMRCDDGFVAYLNGAKIAAKNAPDNLDWRSSALRITDDRQAIRWEDYDITAFRDHFRPGLNMLAIHGLNEKKGSSDALWIAELAGIDREALKPGRSTFRYQVPFELEAGHRIRAAVRIGTRWGASGTLSPVEISK